ncbi:MAG: mercury methylation corrinoid protein HgcA [Geobacteraceae bacterium]|nr:mercury methylation corrinoid protein HgcA [Geobacteraceae bacterium]
MPGFLRWKDTPAGRAPVVSAELCFGDRLGSWKARWGIGRMSYLVAPGLYAIGAPSPDAPVLVTANYKMSYDLVRRELSGRDVWLLVLETYGINVWCAAGKGTFGTGELVRRVQATRLAEVVSHRLLLLPILGAAGVSAHEVRRRTGFTVRYATIRASDLPEYLDNGMTTTPAMRELTFTPGERLILTPIELVVALKGSIPILLVLLFLGGTAAEGFSLSAAVGPVIAYLGAVLAGALVAPLLLPWLPTRSFAVKGAFAGLVWALLWYGASGMGGNGYIAAAHFLLLPAVASFLALNFTGSTPFTSRSGVKKEMRLSLPIMALSIVVGAVLWVAGRFFSA